MNISYANNDKVLVNKIAKHISKIYSETLSPDQIDACYKKVISLLDAIRKDKNEVVERWSEDTVVLITYANTISSKEEKPLKILDKFLSDYCENIISIVHILPFFPSSSDDLPSKKVNNWHGLLFANLQNDDSFESFISVVEDRMNFLNIEDFQFDSKLDKTHHLDTNWMLYVDNYLEGFHIPFVHNELNSVLDYSSYETQLFDNGVLQIGFAKEGEAKFALPKNHVDYGKSIAAYYWWLFPNLMLNFYPWGLSINLVNPNGYSKTTVKYHGLIADQTKVGMGAGGDVDLVELQDQEIVEACFRGMKSSLYNRGRYSPKMEMGVHHFHRILTN